MARDTAGNPTYALEQYDSKKNTWRDLMRGSLLLDFYDKCMGKIVDWMRKQLTVPPGEANLPAGPTQQRLSALTNLLAQIANPQTGLRIFVSPREHKLLLDFYNGLKALLQSETFCAQFDDARPFPNYPFGTLGLDTIFGRGRHVRLRLRPDGKEAYTVGPGINPLKPSTVLNRYDLDKNLLIAQFDPLAGAQATGTQTDTGAGAIQDVAFSPDSRLIYVIASTRAEENSFFRVGQITATGINWRPVVTICGVKLLTLGVTAADKTNIYAVGRKKAGGGGLYQINPDAVDPNMKPFKDFEACGHLEITSDGRAFATAAAAGADPLTYTSIKRYSLPSGAEAGEIKLETAGRDDIAIEPERGLLYAVVGSKQIAVYGMADGRPRASVPVANTTVRLEPFLPTGMLLVTSEDGYQLATIDMASNQVTANALPMQVAPIAVAAHPTTKRAYVLNQASDTVSVITADVLKPDFRFDYKALAAYRKAALEAYVDLAGAFAQYAKDCFCDRFLVDCPDCGDQDKLYLACVSVRNGKVKKVCNFSKRRYVKSFPTVDYWLSVIPLAPVVKMAFEKFCCTVLPDIFRKYNAPDFNEQPSLSNMRFTDIRDAVVRTQAADVPSRYRQATAKAGIAKNLVLDAVRKRAPETFAQSTAATASTNIVGQPVDKVEANLKAAGVTVTRATYDPAIATDLPSGIVGVFRAPQAGSKVTVYEQDGVVRYYAVAPTDSSTELRAQINTLSTALQAREADVKALRTDLDASQQKIAQLSGVQQQVTTLSEQLRAREADMGTLKTQLSTLMTRLPPIR